jgi:4-amino-4-deoxy-L-arabinose transferase-like glycosyltransferase
LLERRIGRLTVRDFVLLIAFCIPLFFIGLGVPPLLDVDEPVYAATALNAVHSGTFSAWWSPHYNGGLWFDKPPLTYWLIGLSQSIFGATSFAARLPSAIFAVALIVLVAYLCRYLWPESRSTGLWAAIVLATSFETVLLARTAVTDMILTALLTGAFFRVWLWLDDEKNVKQLFAAGIFTGLAALTKGPVAIVLVAGTILFYLLITKQFVRLLSWQLWLSLIVSVVVALPWYVSMIHLHGSLFIHGFLEANNMVRYLKPEHPQQQSLTWFVPVLMGFIFPWTLPMFLAGASAIAGIRKGSRSALFLMIWALWVFAFFSFSQTKLQTYIYPMYPALACMIGRWIVMEPNKLQRIGTATIFCIVAAGLAIVLPGAVAHTNGLVEARPILNQLCMVFVVTAGVIAVSFLPVFKESKAAKAIVFAGPAICMSIFFPMVAVARIWHDGIPDLSLPDMGAYIGSHTPPSQPTLAFTLKRPSLVYYSERQIIFSDDAKLIVKNLVEHPQELCAVKKKFLPQLVQQLPDHRYKIMLQSGENYVLIKYDN